MMKEKEAGMKLSYILFLVIAIVYLAPLAVTLSNSFMSSREVEKNYGTERYIDMNIIPEKVTLSQYSKLLIDSPVYLNMFWNSVKLAVPIVLGQLLVSVLAAYAFTVMKFRGKEVVFLFYIIVMLLPLQVTLMPNYIVADWMNIKESYLAIILPAVFNPFGVFLLRQYMKSMPSSYIEAAQMDGAGHGRILWSIILPMVKPGLAAVAMLTLLDYWNIVDQAVVFIQDADKQPLSTFLAQINSGELGLAFSGSVFYAVPVLLILFYGQDYLKKGIAITGMK